MREINVAEFRLVARNGNAVPVEVQHVTIFRLVEVVASSSARASHLSVVVGVPSVANVSVEPLTMPDQVFGS